MAEPWVPKAELAPQQTKMVAIEATGALIVSSTTSISASLTTSLANLDAIKLLTKQTINPLLLGGC